MYLIQENGCERCALYAYSTLVLHRVLMNDEMVGKLCGVGGQTGVCFCEVCLVLTCRFTVQKKKKLPGMHVVGVSEGKCVVAVARQPLHI